MSDIDMNEDKVAARSRDLFIDSARAIDGETGARLAAARGRAMNALAEKPSRVAMRWMPVAGVVAAVSLVAVVWLPAGPGDDLPLPVNGRVLENPADIDILLQEDGLEMIEDLDFYSWIDTDAGAAQDLVPAPAREVNHES
jgi:hypothetical protein